VITSPSPSRRAARAAQGSRGVSVHVGPARSFCRSPPARARAPARSRRPARARRKKSVDGVPMPRSRAMAAMFVAGLHAEARRTPKVLESRPAQAAVVARDLDHEVGRAQAGKPRRHRGRVRPVVPRDRLRRPGGRRGSGRKSTAGSDHVPRAGPARHVPHSARFPAGSGASPGELRRRRRKRVWPAGLRTERQETAAGRTVSHARQVGRDAAVHGPRCRRRGRHPQPRRAGRERGRGGAVARGASPRSTPVEPVRRAGRGKKLASRSRPGTFGEPGAAHPREHGSTRARGNPHVVAPLDHQLGSRGNHSFDEKPASQASRFAARSSFGLPFDVRSEPRWARGEHEDVV